MRDEEGWWVKVEVEGSEEDRGGRGRESEGNRVEEWLDIREG